MVFLVLDFLSLVFYSATQVCVVRTARSVILLPHTYCLEKKACHVFVLCYLRKKKPFTRKGLAIDLFPGAVAHAEGGRRLHT